MEENRTKRPAAFLDRDGVLIRDHGYVYRPEDLEILPGVLEALRWLKERGYLLIAVTNQSGVARSYFTLEDVERFHVALQEQLRSELGFGLDGIYVCPHHPDASDFMYAIVCQCRKPSTGLLEQAAEDFEIDWTRSFLVGDKASDMECARRAGIPGIQVLTGQYEADSEPSATIQSMAELPNLLAAHLDA
jgi:D-glycero-D-manno-heptose 1,7-bisphosphate phosphatase